MAKKIRADHEGIEVRHGTGCPALTAGRCGCSPRYRASVWSVRDGKKVRKSFRTLAEARAWRSDGQSALRAGVMRAPSSRRLSDAAEGWLEGARAGAVRNRSGDVYKPSTIRGYEQSLRLRLLPEFGTARIGDIARSDVQDFVDRMMLAGHDAATVRNTLMPLRVIFRRALVRGEVAVNPTIGLELPAVRGTRDRVASPLEARQLLLALSQDREVWATAMYAGLRLGEIQALTWDAVDLERNVIQVVRSWDPVEGPIAPKSRAGHRVVPVPTVLRELLLAYRVGRPHGDELVFGRSGGRTFNPWSINTRAYRVWKKAGLNRITLHECRHTYASFMIAAGVNAKALSTYMGHSSVTITFDRYGHLMPGNEAEAASLLDTYLHGRSGRASA